MFSLYANIIRRGKKRVKKVKETLLRLCLTGHSRDEAIELIACALAPEMHAVVEQRQPFDLVRYEAHLGLLPDTPWLDEE